MRVALCQINTTVGAFDDNRARVVAFARDAHAQGAELSIFCELTLPGYRRRDLLDRGAFVDASMHALEALARELPRGHAALVGFVERARDGGRLHNAAALMQDGRVVQVFHKRLLPTYDVFDEARYFTKGRKASTFELAGVRFGVTICEDAWNDGVDMTGRAYEENPVGLCVQEGAQVLINLAASPFTLRKPSQRAAMLQASAKRHGRALCFVNAVGGNDDLIFDGSSGFFDAQGVVRAQAKSFDEDLVVVDLAQGGTRAELPPTDAQAALEALTLGTRDYVRKCGFRSAVLGLSGGIDSALVACIAARALGPENVLGVAMPTRYSSQGSKDDASALAQALGIHFLEIDIDPIFQAYIDGLGPAVEALAPPQANDTTYENIQARIRGNTLMAISNRAGHLLLTTGNKSEVAVGYCTLYGDMAGGLAVISDLPKTFVYQVAREANRSAGRASVPESTFTKPPSAELRPNQTDQDSLPAYELLDAILERLVEQQLSIEQVIAQGYARDVVVRVAGLLRTSEYKRKQMPPGLIVTSKAFGSGRRYPIAQRFRD